MKKPAAILCILFCFFLLHGCDDNSYNEGNTFLNNGSSDYLGSSEISDSSDETMSSKENDTMKKNSETKELLDSFTYFWDDDGNLNRAKKCSYSDIVTFYLRYDDGEWSDEWFFDGKRNTIYYSVGPYNPMTLDSYSKMSKLSKDELNELISVFKQAEIHEWDVDSGIEQTAENTLFCSFYLEYRNGTIEKHFITGKATGKSSSILTIKKFLSKLEYEKNPLY